MGETERREHDRTVPRRLVLTLYGDSTDIEIDFQGMLPYEAPLVLEAARGKVMQTLRGGDG